MKKSLGGKMWAVTFIRPVRKRGPKCILVVILQHPGSYRFCKEDPGY